MHGITPFTPSVQEIQKLLADLQDQLIAKGCATENRNVIVSFQINLDGRAQISLHGNMVAPDDIYIKDVKLIYGEFDIGPDSVWSKASEWVRQLEDKATRDRKHFLKMASELLEFGRQSGHIEAVIMGELENIMKRLSENILEDKRRYEPDLEEIADFEEHKK